MKLKISAKMRLRLITVVLCRILVGVTFLIAGWAKAIDPWGFVIKTGEYLGLCKIPRRR